MGDEEATLSLPEETRLYLHKMLRIGILMGNTLGYIHIDLYKTISLHKCRMDITRHWLGVEPALSFYV